MRPLLLAAALTLTVGGTGSAAANVELARVRGSVAYGDFTAPMRPLIGRIAVTDDARLATEARAAATITLPDSSVVEVGDRSNVLLAAFTTGNEVNPQRVTVTRGAIRFTVRHPRGEKSNYVFQTLTSQVAVRGTRAYVVTGPNGDQIYCVDCPRGDVVATVGNRSYPVATGQTLDVRRVGSAVDAAIVANATINNPAIDQFLDGRSPFGEPAATGNDPTGSTSGAL